MKIERDEVRDLHDLAGALGAQPGMKPVSYTHLDVYKRQAQEEMRQAVAVKANIDHLLGVTDGQRKKEQER